MGHHCYGLVVRVGQVDYLNPAHPSARNFVVDDRRGVRAHRVGQEGLVGGGRQGAQTAEIRDGVENVELGGCWSEAVYLESNKKEIVHF